MGQGGQVFGREAGLSPNCGLSTFTPLAPPSLRPAGARPAPFHDETMAVLHSRLYPIASIGHFDLGGAAAWPCGRHNLALLGYQKGAA
jgi:hypothetical protein